MPLHNIDVEGLDSEVDEGEAHILVTPAPSVRVTSKHLMLRKAAVINALITFIVAVCCVVLFAYFPNLLPLPTGAATALWPPLHMPLPTSAAIAPWPTLHFPLLGIDELSSMHCNVSDTLLSKFDIGPGYDGSRPLVTGMASGGIGNRIALMISSITVAEVLKRPMFIMWNVTDDGSSWNAKQNRLLHDKLHVGQRLGQCFHGCYDWYTFRQCISLPRAMPFFLDEMTNMTARLFKCIATMGSILPTPYDIHEQGPAIEKRVTQGTGDQYPRPWLKRLERMSEIGLFLSRAELRAFIPNDDVFLQAYGAVASQLGPSSILQTCLPKPNTYVALHVRCGDGDTKQCNQGHSLVARVVDKVAALPSDHIIRRWRWMILSNSKALISNGERRLIQSLGVSYLVRPLGLGKGTCIAAGIIDINTFEAMRDYFTFKQASAVLSPLGKSSMSGSAAYAGNTPLFTDMSAFWSWSTLRANRNHAP